MGSDSVNKMSYWITAAWIFTVTFLVIIATIVKKSKKTGKNLPPGPPGLPIIGNLHQLGSRPHRSLLELSRKYGPLMYLKLGTVPTVVASSPETIREVLKTYDAECCSRPHLSVPARLTYNLNDLAFSPYNEYWRELRKMSMLELYNAKRVHSFKYIREEEISSFVKFLKHSALSGASVNLNRKFMELSGSVICRVAFGMHLRGSKLQDKFEEVITEVFRLLGSFSAEDLFPYFGWIIDRLSGLHGRREKIFWEFDEFYEQAIKRHIEKKSEDGQEDFIDLLLRMEKEQEGLGLFQLTRTQIKGILVNIIMAGIDTSAQTLTWVMTRLITNPRVMKKVQAEVRERIKNKDDITERDIEHLEYLRLVIKETFRINSLVLFLIPREASTDLKINGYDIPKKTRIQVNIWALGRNPEFWENPEEFIPERFMNRDIDYKGQNFELLPFGSGRRVCPGLTLGMSLVHSTLINLLYRFDWKLPEGMKEEDVDLDETYGLVSSKKIPLELIPVITQWT